LYPEYCQVTELVDEVLYTEESRPSGLGKVAFFSSRVKADSF
jgi:hypothetical protein